MRALKLLVPAWAASLLVVASGAEAATGRFPDPAGDGLKGRALDITSLRLANRDHAIVATVSFVRATRGDLYVRLLARGESRRTMTGVSTIHRARGDTNRVVTIDGVQECPGLGVAWDHDSDRVRVRLPSRCLVDGDYGAVKAKVITEIGSDADLAPKDDAGRWRWTDWVARG